jgi:2-haloacid dehalogenase
LREYHDRESLWEHVEPDVVPALARLRGRGFRLVVVSNANGRLRQLFDRLDLARWFTCLLDSHEWGVEKPDPRLFQAALEASGATAARTVHVGDLYHVDVAGARNAGLGDAILYDVARLYDQADCRRVYTLTELADLEFD